jgi:hypothetical protein
MAHRMAAQGASRSPPGGTVRNDLDPGCRGQQAVVVQFPDVLLVGLHEGLQDPLVVLPAVCRLGRPANEGPHRGLPGLDVRVVAVAQDIHPRERPRRERRPQLHLNGVRHCPIHAFLPHRRRPASYTYGT